MGFDALARKQIAIGKARAAKSARAANLKRTAGQVQGDKEIIALLGEIEPKVAKKAVRQSLRKGAKDIILKEAKIRVPHDTGELEQSLTVRAMKRSRIGFGYEVVSRATADATKYAFVVEFGSKHQPNQSYLRPAGYGNEPRVQSLVVADIKETLRGLKANNL